MSYTTKQNAIAPFILRTIHHLFLVLQNLKGLWFETRGDDSVTDLSFKNLFEKVIEFLKNDVPSIRLIDMRNGFCFEKVDPNVF